MNTLNRLAQQTSPYLKQHADNPVDWYPWGPEALEKAKKENKPILLSIGYSACHWCHVMAAESFADEETAKIMNEFFINIKVDKEERPDLDTVYQTLHSLLTNKNGGWPLTVCLDPQHHFPFFSGTYFPKVARYQLPDFKSVLKDLADFYQKHQQEINTQGEKLQATLNYSPPPDFSAASHNWSIEPWQQAIKQLAEKFDPVNGGFDGAPKFPNPTYLELLIYDMHLSKSDSANHTTWNIIEKTLTKMAMAGIYDQVGGGFYRYSVDEKWEIPHFEKMLYDNAQLLSVYAKADQLKPDPLFKKVMHETAIWVLRNMQSSKGGYYTTLNADSENKEGLFYIWTKEQIHDLLSPHEYQKVLLYFNLQQPPNFENSWHLQVVKKYDHVAEQSRESIAEVKKYLDSALVKLHQEREKRIHPSRDEKILTSWNALMMKGMLMAGVRLNKQELIESAERSLNFVYSSLWKDGCLLANCKDGQAHLAAYLDDYAYLLDAVLVFLQHRWRTQDLLFAKALADELLLHFFDSENFGFFFVANTHEQLVYRPKIFTDGVMPAGNGVACYALQRLGYLLGESRYLTAVEKTLQTVWSLIQQAPAVHASLLVALRECLVPPHIIIIRGNDAEIHQWKMSLQEKNMPSQLVFSISDDESNLSGALAEKKPIHSGVVAYVCKGQQCLFPVADLLELKNILE